MSRWKDNDMFLLCDILFTLFTESMEKNCCGTWWFSTWSRQSSFWPLFFYRDAVECVCALIFQIVRTPVTASWCQKQNAVVCYGTYQFDMKSSGVCRLSLIWSWTNTKLQESNPWLGMCDGGEALSLQHILFREKHQLSQSQWSCRTFQVLLNSKEDNPYEHLLQTHSPDISQPLSSFQARKKCIVIIKTIS